MGLVGDGVNEIIPKRSGRKTKVGPDDEATNYEAHDPAVKSH